MKIHLLVAAVALCLFAGCKKEELKPASSNTAAVKKEYPRAYLVKGNYREVSHWRYIDDYPTTTTYKIDSALLTYYSADSAIFTFEYRNSSSIFYWYGDTTGGHSSEQLGQGITIIDVQILPDSFFYYSDLEVSSNVYFQKISFRGKIDRAHPIWMD